MIVSLNVINIGHMLYNDRTILDQPPATANDCSNILDIGKRLMVMVSQVLKKQQKLMKNFQLVKHWQQKDDNIQSERHNTSSDTAISTQLNGKTAFLSLLETRLSLRIMVGLLTWYGKARYSIK